MFGGGGGSQGDVFAVGFFAFEIRAKSPTHFLRRNLAKLLVVQLFLPHAQHL